MGRHSLSGMGERMDPEPSDRPLGAFMLMVVRNFERIARGNRKNNYPTRAALMESMYPTILQIEELLVKHPRRFNQYQRQSIRDAIARLSKGISDKDWRNLAK